MPVGIVLCSVDHPALHIVAPLDIEYIEQFLLQFLIQDRRRYLYSRVEVARHPVGRGDIVQRVASILKDEYPRVLQVAVYDADHLYILAHARYSGY